MYFTKNFPVIYSLNQRKLGLSILFIDSVLQTHANHNLDFYIIWIPETYQVFHGFSIRFIKCHLVDVNLSPKTAL